MKTATLIGSIGALCLSAFGQGAIDYSNRANWMRLPTEPEHPEHKVDVVYLYPTSVPKTCTNLVGDVSEEMKAAAEIAYLKGASTFSSFANIYAPYYRQASLVAIMANAAVDKLQAFCRTNVGKTDVFAALDRYFTMYNPGLKRPFILASHSQGSCLMKIAFEEYFVGTKRAYLDRMVACYAIGYAFPKAWCEKYGVRFATNETDTGVLISWEAEGPDMKLSNMLTRDRDGQAINPLNWKTDETPAARTENLGSVEIKNGRVVRIPGACAARLDKKRPGTVVVTESTIAPLPENPFFGSQSHHLDDWALFYDNIATNALRRLASFENSSM